MHPCLVYAGPMYEINFSFQHIYSECNWIIDKFFRLIKPNENKTLLFFGSYVSQIGKNRLENFTGNGIVSSGGGSGINEYVKKQFDSSITWNDVKWLVGYVFFCKQIFLLTCSYARSLCFSM